MCKGIDGQNIFYDDKDRRYFLKQLLETKENFKYSIYAYCLMSNHIHLVIEIDENFLAKAIQSLNIRYAYYFNKKYLRSGPLFRGRFTSKNVENQRYFLDVCRYVHQNPEKAGICKTEDYKWSSYHEYIGKEKIINKRVLLHYFNNDTNNFIKYTTNQNSDNEYDFIEYELRNTLNDDELAEIIIRKLNIENINDVSKFDEEQLKQSVEILKTIQYTTLSQISRVTRINRWRIEKYFKS